MQALRHEGLPDFDRGKGGDRSKGPKDSPKVQRVILENAFGAALNCYEEGVRQTQRWLRKWNTHSLVLIR